MMEKITVWETFFMLLTVIPVSKMLSSIFMKLVARVGTVDEDKWAMIGLGAIGATFGLMKKGGLMGGLTGLSGGSAGPGNITPGPPGPPDPAGSLSGPAVPGAGNINAGVSGNAGIQGRSMSGGNFTFAGNGAAPGPGGQRNNTMNESSALGTENLEVAANGTNYGTFQNHGQTAQYPEIGRRNLNDIINISGQTGNKAAGTMAKVGAASSFAVPEVAPAMAGIYALAGKATGGFASATYSLAQEVRTRRQNGQSFWQAMQDITGTNNRVAATTQVATALALSPMGRRVAGLGTQVTGRAINWATYASKKLET